MNAYAAKRITEDQRKRYRSFDAQQKSEKEQKKQWEQRVQECEENYWRSKLGKPLLQCDIGIEKARMIKGENKNANERVI